jgi:hypothetical protein
VEVRCGEEVRTTSARSRACMLARAWAKRRQGERRGQPLSRERHIPGADVVVRPGQQHRQAFGCRGRLWCRLRVRRRRGWNRPDQRKRRGPAAERAADRTDAERRFQRTGHLDALGAVGRSYLAAARGMGGASRSDACPNWSRNPSQRRNWSCRPSARTLAFAVGACLLVSFHDDMLVALHAILKKAQKTPADELALARQRFKEYSRGKEKPPHRFQL